MPGGEDGKSDFKDIWVKKFEPPAFKSVFKLMLFKGRQHWKLKYYLLKYFQRLQTLSTINLRMKSAEDSIWEIDKIKKLYKLNLFYFMSKSQVSI